MLLNQNHKPTARHYLILAMAWAGWVFDFYDLMLFSFLPVAIKRDLGLADTQLSVLLGAWAFPSSPARFRTRPSARISRLWTL